jgi:ADP-ribose pyrophosphatase YjhB (NUDIX family)
MNFSFNLKNTIVGLLAIGAIVGLFFIHALAGFSSDSVTFEEPPAFVATYASSKYGPQDVNFDQESIGNLTKDYFNDAALVRDVIVNGESTDELIRRFTSTDKATRVKIAFAFGDVNLKLSHDEGTGFDEKRDVFWGAVKEHESAIQNALFEALIVSAQERTRNFIPYTLAWWMEDDKPKAVEMLTWAAKHHPDPWVRSFSVFYVVRFGGDEDKAVSLIADRTHDPVYRVRKAVLNQRYRRFKEAIFGPEEAS